MPQAASHQEGETPAEPPTPTAEEASARTEESALETSAPEGGEAPQTADVQAASEKEIVELKDKLLRALAEVENVRRRAQRDVEETSRYAVTGFARDTVSVLENLVRATASISPEARAENELLRTLGEGVDMTIQEFSQMLQRHGVKRIDPLGEKFDHNFHQAVAQIEDPSHPPGTVVQVLQAGYVLHDRLLRPAMVGVSRQGEPPTKLDTTA